MLGPSGNLLTANLFFEHEPAVLLVTLRLPLEPWMQWIWEFGRETCLSQGDLLRLTHDMIDERQGTITPAGGRKKTKVLQVSPLTDRAREIFDEIKTAKKSGAIVSNLNGLVFTLNDGTRITKGLIHVQVEKAIKATGVKKFVFHNLRNTTLTNGLGKTSL